jgi:hypothetical protein
MEMGATESFETLVPFYRSERRHAAENSNLYEANHYVTFSVFQRHLLSTPFSNTLRLCLLSYCKQFAPFGNMLIIFLVLHNGTFFKAAGFTLCKNLVSFCCL